MKVAWVGLRSVGLVVVRGTSGSFDLLKQDRQGCQAIQLATFPLCRSSGDGRSSIRATPTISSTPDSLSQLPPQLESWLPDGIGVDPTRSWGFATKSRGRGLLIVRRLGFFGIADEPRVAELISSPVGASIARSP